MHPDGAVAIVDRSKDIIISGGEVFFLPSLMNFLSQSSW
jgi:acyl-CoA synthetase (AMP-forming)/AMP-acid ligase II